MAPILHPARAPRAPARRRSAARSQRVVHLSARQFARPDLAAHVATILAETGLAPASLELEITESLAMSDSEATGVTLRALHELGVRLALDDFGTGYSSLASLSQLPLDVIKVDRSFVAGLRDSPVNLAIVRAVVGLAQGLGISVTAEGIEREDQLEALRELGCDRGQGFLFARPLPAAEAGAALARHGRGTAAMEPPEHDATAA